MTERRPPQRERESALAAVRAQSPKCGMRSEQGMSDCAKQSQSAISQKAHRQAVLDDATREGASDSAKQTQLPGGSLETGDCRREATPNVARQTKPIQDRLSSLKWEVSSWASPPARENRSRRTKPIRWSGTGRAEQSQFGRARGWCAKQTQFRTGPPVTNKANLAHRADGGHNPLCGKGGERGRSPCCANKANFRWTRRAEQSQFRAGGPGLRPWIEVQGDMISDCGMRIEEGHSCAKQSQIWEGWEIWGRIRLAGGGQEPSVRNKANGFGASNGSGTRQRAGQVEA
jgi:hypothetical protein